MAQNRFSVTGFLLVLSVATGLVGNDSWASPLRTGAAIAQVRAVGGLFAGPATPLTLPIQVENVEELGAATIWVGYDPTLLSVTACRPNSAFDVGLCNPLADRNQDGAVDAVLFNVVALDGLGAAGQPVDLAQITWRQVGKPGDAPAQLTLFVETFTNAAADPIPFESFAGQILLSAQTVLYLPVLNR